MRVLLDTPHRIFFESPKAVITADRPAQLPAALAEMETALASGCYVAGWFGYELGFALEPAFAQFNMPQDVPLLRLGIFDAPAAQMPALQGRAYVGQLEPEWNAAAYKERFAKVKRFIADGDIYQANLSFRTRFAFVGDALSLYERLRLESGAQHCAFVEATDADGATRQIVSISPELFFSINADGTITTRPMKGTAPRVNDNDDSARATLAVSVKDRAENLMIVDLIRNDLGRIAETGSVQVSNLFEVETYPTLHTMVSTVTARKRPDMRSTDVLKALFPCGSITGAPKIRAMEILQALESSPRGVYCGAIGHFAPDGSAHFNVAIRTITIANGRGELGIGGGVVHDSNQDAEYAECLLKANFLQTARKPIQLIETLRYEGTFQRLESHLSRMAASARVFGLPFDVLQAREALQAAVENKSGALRVRLTLDEAGERLATTEPLAPNPPHWRCKIAETPILSTDLLRRHKTNWRDNAGIAADVDETLFCNERGELAEGTRSNIFLKRDGALLTPPLSAGILDGRLRAELLAQGKARETTLRPEDLQAGILFCGNSLRGLIPAVLELE